MNDSIFNIIGLVFWYASILIFLFYTIPRMIIELNRPKDMLTRLRQRMLMMGILIVVMATIPLISRYFRIIGIDAEMLRNISSVTSAALFFVFSLSFADIYRSKDKEK